MVDFERKDFYNIRDYRRIMELLRAPGGCPWDAEQTHESIRRNLLEEAYECVAAIDSGDAENLCEELGDLQMQILFHARMEEEKGVFSFDDICDGACKKLIYRHPHVFGNVAVDGSAQVLDNWEALKRTEKGQSTVSRAMTDVAETLPALWRAEKIQKKAAKVGFDWPDWTGARDKILEELAEVTEAVDTHGDVAGEIGDLLAAVVNMARLLKVDPEQALHGSCERFINRFTCMEQQAEAAGTPLETLPLSRQDELWELAKQKLS